MYKNIGKKIKAVAVAVCIIGIVLSILLGIALILSTNVAVGIIVIILGAFFSWIGSFVTYGFGELVDSNSKMEEKLSELKDVLANKN